DEVLNLAGDSFVHIPDIPKRGTNERGDPVAPPRGGPSQMLSEGKRRGPDREAFIPEPCGYQTRQLAL
ncbi:MAG: hypothetical protein VST65_03730, partial [Nitrospirota bacterium]|nr:hypothetical protein [Nitrospirota bacterium]